MSAPETKAFSPAPFSTITRIAGSASSRSSASGSARHMATESALCFAGLLKVIQPTAPAVSTSNWSVMSFLLYTIPRSRKSSISAAP